MLDPAGFKSGIQVAHEQFARIMGEDLLDCLSQIGFDRPVKLVRSPLEMAEHPLPVDTDDHIRHGIDNRLV